MDSNEKAAGGRAGRDRAVGHEYRRAHRDADPIEIEIEEEGALTADEVEKVHERVQLRAPAIFAIVREEGEAELARPSSSLFASGLVAGVAMGFSVLGLSAIRRFMPDVTWEPLVSSFGYSFGFLIVILGRQQLFTESTITAVLPLTSHPSWRTLGNTGRVWGVVLVANWIGCVLVAAGFTLLPVIPDEIAAEILAFSKHLTDYDAWTAFQHGIGAGFLIAALVWMMPIAETNKLWLIVLVTWLIAVGGFTHAIAGMVEIVVLVLKDEVSIADGVLTLALPTLAGNIVGGTVLFAALAYAQVRSEVEAGNG